MNNDHRRRMRVLTAAVLVAMACTTGAEGPPEVTLERTACSHCGMLISSIEFSAAARSRTDGTTKTFDDAVCLLQTSLPGSWDIWFSDYEGSGWIGSSQAALVVNSDARTPMGGGILAFRDVPRARAFASQHRGAVLSSFAELQKAREDRS